MKNNILNFIKENIIITIIITLSIISLVICSLLYLYKPYEVNKDFSSIDLQNYDNLMIVAHPDDDILWGGAHLIEDNYLVVCVTCGPIKERVNEFISVMNATNDKYIMLGYPDKTNGERDNWDTVKDDISKDLESIVNLKDWNIIVTHNPLGEYGHIHHKMTNTMITELVENKDVLYYFGKYYSKKEITEHYDELYPINGSTYRTKKHIIGLYKSQSFIQTSFNHMFEYENWIKYSDWSEE